MHDNQNSKRILKNTVFLYLRLLFTVVVGLYTSRVILGTLGVEDYGINNVVGGIVAMLSFFQSALIGATQRFFSFELGTGDDKRLKDVFSSSMIVLLFFAVVIVFLSETLGLWFVNTQLNINPDRMYAANWVYQLSILTFLMSIMVVPYNSSIIAHEQMKAFAYIGILETMLKLGAVFCLKIGGFDKLIFFAVLMFVVQCIVRFCVRIYSKRNFEECDFHWIWNKEILRKLFSFSGWTILGNLGFVGRDQGGNVILNLFYGTTLNASRGVAMQVSNIINTFAHNFIMALNPQITKTYAAGDYNECKKLVYSGAKLSFFLLSIFSIPLMLNIDYVLKLWLGEVPPYTGFFVQLSLFASLIYMTTQTVTVAIQATGNLMLFQIGVCVLVLSELPFVWLLLSCGFPPYVSMIPTIVSNFILVFFRYYLLKKYAPLFHWKDYIVQVLFRCSIVFIVCYGVGYIVVSIISGSFPWVLLNIILTLTFLLFFSYTVGLSKEERQFVVRNVKAFVEKHKGKTV